MTRKIDESHEGSAPVLTVRLSPSLMAALKSEADRRSNAAGGVPVSIGVVARLVLESALRDGLAARPVDASQSANGFVSPPINSIERVDDDMRGKRVVGVSRAIVRHLVKHGVTPEMKLVRIAYGQCDARAVDLFSRPIKKLVRIGFVVEEPAKAAGDSARVYRVTQSGREWLMQGDHLPSPLFNSAKG